MFSDKVRMDAEGIPSVGSDKYKKFMRTLEKTPDFYSFITKKIEDQTDEEFLELLNKLKTYYAKFKVKWAKILSSRKKTEK